MAKKKDEVDDTTKVDDITKVDDTTKNDDTTVIKTEDGKVININVALPKIEAGKTYTAEEVEKLTMQTIQSAQKIVKDQLYPDIKRANDKVKELEDKLAASTNKDEKDVLEAQLKTATEKVKALEDYTVKTNDDVVALKNELNTERLDKYRLSKIAEANGQIIADMVVGQTKEEIDSSVEKAKKTFDDTQKELRKKYKLPDTPDTPPDPKVDDVPVKRINPMDNDSIREYNSKRKQLIADVYGQYGVKVE
jgi:predicted  nucleic acid-binding Zn-ribbon protein